MKITTQPRYTPPGTIAFWLLQILAICVIAVALSTPLLALEADVGATAEAVAAPAATGSDLTAVLVSVLDPLVVQHPWLSMALLVIGGLRTLFKPLVSWLEARAAATPDTADDERLKKAEASWWFRALAWALDFTASIKVGPQRK